MSRIVIYVLWALISFSPLHLVFGQGIPKFEIISHRIVVKVKSTTTKQVWAPVDTSKYKGIIFLVKAHVTKGTKIYPNDFYLAYEKEGSATRAYCKGSVLSSTIETNAEWFFYESSDIIETMSVNETYDIHINLLFTIPADVNEVTLMLLQPIANSLLIKGKKK